MKSFYGGTYIAKELLVENNIYHPIRLEYYKIENQAKSKVFYGVEIIKTEYQKEEVKVEKNELEYITRRRKRNFINIRKIKNRKCHTKFFRRNVERIF